MRTHYSPADLRRALSELRLEKGDVVFSHSNLGFFGRPEGRSDSDAICEMVFDEIMTAIGSEGTLIVPTFTYSFPRGEVFDPINTPSAMGAFAEWVRCHNDAHRSVDPCYSVAAIGGRAVALTRDVPENSFARDSFFGRFHRAAGKILNLNFDAASTFVHYVERELNVPYRFDKTFSGSIRIDGKNVPAKSTIWVRYLSDDALCQSFEAFDALAREQGMVKSMAMGRGQINLITAEDTFRLIEETLPTRPWFLTMAEVNQIDHPVITPE